ncbi:MAG: SufD family Fe-S cluster assembly protein [Lachnospiraceae bacterium]|nr:SufD family Fe-S cluster assembly protein [Lachnospiraceae bacterium]
MSELIKVNNIPAPTWNHLRMNDANVSIVKDFINKDIKTDAEAVTSLIGDNGKVDIVEGSAIAEVKTGMGDEIYDKVVNSLYKDTDNKVLHIYVDEDKNVEKPVMLSFEPDGSLSELDSLYVEVSKGASLTIYMKCAEEIKANDASGSDSATEAKTEAKDGADKASFIASFKAKVAENAKLTLVQVYGSVPNVTVFNDIGVTVEDKGNFNLVQIFKGDTSIYSGLRTDLIGDKSELDVNIGYDVNSDHVLDLNYISNHFGKKTLSSINVAGVLYDTSKKTFRGSIDFKNGSSGSVGHEVEDVLLMDDEVHNKTIPLILCAEEDVSGTHGATIGRIDDEISFYLETRGIAKEKVYDIMAKAKTDSIIAKISDSDVKNDISKLLYGASEDE